MRTADSYLLSIAVAAIACAHAAKTKDWPQETGEKRAQILRKGSPGGFRREWSGRGAPGRWVNNAVNFWGGAGPPGGRTHLILVPDWTGVAREGRASSEFGCEGSQDLERRGRIARFCWIRHSWDPGGFRIVVIGCNVSSPPLFPLLGEGHGHWTRIGINHHRAIEPSQNKIDSSRHLLHLHQHTRFVVRAQRAAASWAEWRPDGSLQFLLRFRRGVCRALFARREVSKVKF